MSYAEKISFLEVVGASIGEPPPENALPMLVEESPRIELIQKWLDIYLQRDMQLFMSSFPIAPGVSIVFWNLEVDNLLETYSCREGNKSMHIGFLVQGWKLLLEVSPEQG